MTEEEEVQAQAKADSRFQLRENLNLQFKCVLGILESQESEIDYLQKQINKLRIENLKDKAIADKVIGASHSIGKALDHWGMEDFGEELNALVESREND